MIDVLWTITRYGAAIVLGVIIGKVFTLGKTKVHGHEITVPFIQRRDRNTTYVTVILMGLSLFAVANTSISANRQADCNSEFRRVIAERSQITTQDNELRAKLDKLNSSDSTALSNFLDSTLGVQPVSPTLTQLKASGLKSVLSNNNDERNGIREMQQDLAKQRASNMYPAPRCNA